MKAGHGSCPEFLPVGQQEKKKSLDIPVIICHELIDSRNLYKIRFEIKDKRPVLEYQGGVPSVSSKEVFGSNVPDFSAAGEKEGRKYGIDQSV